MTILSKSHQGKEEGVVEEMEGKEDNNIRDMSGV